VHIGLQFRQPVGNRGNVIDDLIATAEVVRAAGVSSFWLAHAFEFDALSALTLIGRVVPDIELGTAVVPTYPRHPIVMAQQALTVQAASGGRLTLGIGPSHRSPIEEIFGYSFAGVAANMAEYLEVLLPALDTGNVDFAGQHWVAHTTSPIEVIGASACPVLLGAMGPRMLALAGAVADGTITSKTGPRTIETKIVPAITEAAVQAGRSAPRIAACLPFCLTDHPDAAYELAVGEFKFSESLPSYRSMLDIEGVTHAAEVALIGDEATVTKKLQALADAGLTDYCARLFGTEAEQLRSIEFLGSVNPI
jgi:F420-dependent oxidoreductase-like protein